MYKEKLVECSLCNDRFKIIYDSRKEQQEAYSCKCGELVCYPIPYGGDYEYKRGGSPKSIPYKEQKAKYFYYEEDYIRLTKEEEILMEEIDKIGSEMEDIYENYTNEDSINLSIFGCNRYNEGLKIYHEVRLKSFGEPWSQHEHEQRHDRILTGLKRFKEIILKVKNQEINIDNPKEIWDDYSLEWEDGDMVQHKRYDYELKC